MSYLNSKFSLSEWKKLRTKMGAQAAAPEFPASEG